MYPLAFVKRSSAVLMCFIVSAGYGVDVRKLLKLSGWVPNYPVGLLCSCLFVLTVR